MACLESAPPPTTPHFKEREWGGVRRAIWDEIRGGRRKKSGKSEGGRQGRGEER